MRCPSRLKHSSPLVAGWDPFAPVAWPAELRGIATPGVVASERAHCCWERAGPLCAWRQCRSGGGFLCTEACCPSCEFARLVNLRARCRVVRSHFDEKDCPGGAGNLGWRRESRSLSCLGGTCSMLTSCWHWERRCLSLPTTSTLGTLGASGHDRHPKGCASLRPQAPWVEASGHGAPANHRPACLWW